ncbi:MAG TPA: hypothetical protein VH228_01395 [Nocardioides sp.]|nr:hypothetical protein [Nocardioides sp.]
MNLPEEYRNAIDTLTRDRPGGPDLGAAVSAGRRHRRRRRAVLGGSIAAAAVIALVSVGYATRPHPVVAVDQGPAGQPTYQDFVPGTDLDETFQAAVPDDVPTLPPAKDVYPSDWNTDGPIPDARYADATDWQLVYQVDPGEELAVLMAKKIPGEGAGAGCASGQAREGTAQPACHETDVAAGRLVSDSYTLDLAAGKVFVFTTTLVRPDGSEVAALERVTASSWAEAAGERALTSDDLQPLLTDPRMDFPDPEVAPPPPSSR